MYRYVRYTYTLLGVVVCLACGHNEASGQQVSAGRSASPATARAAISAEELRGHVEVLAHDSLGGREPGMPGMWSATNYLVSQLRRIGLKPAGDEGTYLDRVPLRRWRVLAEVGVQATGGSRTLTSDDILSVSGLGGLPATSQTSGEGPLVYGGHLVDPEAEGQDLKLAQMLGAVIMVRLAAPSGIDPDGAMPRVPLASLFTPMSPAAAVLLVAEAEQAELWSYAAEIARKGNLELIGDDQQARLPPFFLISAAEAERILGAPLADARQPRTGLGTFRFTLRNEAHPVDASNVVAVLPGRDPSLSSEYVALGAHYDHVGLGEPESGDSIYNGADDDASGVAALLEIAEQFASMPADDRPARSLLFVWHTAEEAGLLGSKSYTEHPTVAREGIVAQLNIDMVGRNDPDSLFVVGSRRISGQLGDLIENVNGRQAQPFVLDYSLDVPDHPEQVYCRSDHYNYARYGIPVAFFTTGPHADYHRPSDEASMLNYEKLARVTRLVRDIAAAIGDQPGRLTVDRAPAVSECPL